MKTFMKYPLIGALVFIALVLILSYGFHYWYIIQFPRGERDLSNSILNIDKNFQFPKNFPPDPGEAGKKTIEGIDSDHDGVRDDVQRWIYAYFPNDTKKQMALRQMARYFQDALAEDFGLEVRNRNHIQCTRAIQCISKTFNDELRGETEMGYLEAKVFNTYKRTVRYFDNQNKITTEEMSGAYIEQEEPCDNR